MGPWRNYISRISPLNGGASERYNKVISAEREREKRESHSVGKWNGVGDGSRHREKGEIKNWDFWRLVFFSSFLLCACAVPVMIVQCS